MRAALLVLLSGLAAIVLLVIQAPSYLPTCGFPLDDAWIHAVYGRSIATAGELAYNPGFPATGETSPLWALALALPHTLASKAGVAVLLTKLLGLGLHLVAAVLLVFMLTRDSQMRWLGIAGACLTAFHPDLLSAALSGMEVPLATLIAVGLLYAAQAGRWGWYAVLSVMAPLSRPEVGMFALLLPVTLYLGRDSTRLPRGLIVAILGLTLAWVGVVLRNLAVSGMPLPATFYAKVGHSPMGVLEAQYIGFGTLLRYIVLTDSLAFLLTATALAVWAMLRADGVTRTAAAAYLNGIAFCALSFLLIPPVDPAAFYHQRYVLPALAFLVAPLPFLADFALQHWQPGARMTARVVVVLFLALSTLIASLTRYSRLENDARNIDDVQVAMGRALAAASPNNCTWATDAGAVRFFGAPYIVDLIGLNSPDLLTAGAQKFLDAHPPNYLAVMPAWVGMDDAVRSQLEVKAFATSTDYTVTSNPRMGLQWLARCPASLRDGRIRVLRSIWDFHCSSDDR